MSEIEARGKSRFLICQGHTCRHLGSRQVLEAFCAASPGVEVIGSGCLGQCGNGPMVLVMPDQVWYWGVRVQEVPRLIEHHLGPHT